MKLFWVPPSPYSRKVLATAIEKGLHDQIDLIVANPHDSPEELIMANPLSKVPTLLLDTGEVIFESLLICEYLDTIAQGPTLFPAPGLSRWRSLGLHSLASGLLDAAVLRLVEGRRAEEADRLANIDRQKKIIVLCLDQLEAGVNEFQDRISIGELTVGCAVGFLDFRFPEDPWRNKRPRLAEWYETFANRPSMSETLPRD